MSTISAGTNVNTSLNYSADTTGNLVFQSGSSSNTALTLDSTQNSTFTGNVSVKTSTGTYTDVVRGLAKAWVVYTSTGQLILNSFNVGSVTYNGTGDFTINFTTAMPTANYAVVCSRDAASGFGPYTANRKSGGTYSNTAVRIIVMSSTVVGNFDGCSVAIFS